MVIKWRNIVSTSAEVGQLQIPASLSPNPSWCWCRGLELRQLAADDHNNAAPTVDPMGLDAVCYRIMTAGLNGTFSKWKRHYD